LHDLGVVVLHDLETVDVGIEGAGRRERLARRLGRLRLGGARRRRRRSLVAASDEDQRETQASEQHASTPCNFGAMRRGLMKLVPLLVLALVACKSNKPAA